MTALLFGQSLRHRPVALVPSEQQPVRAVAVEDEERDISARLFPISLSPLLLGLADDGKDLLAALTIRLEDIASSRVIGSIEARSAGSIDFGCGRIQLLRPTASSVRCIGRGLLAWKFLLAWRQARRNARDPHAFHMSFADLRALNVFYMMPRPVYLVSTVHEEASNIFPMDLVGPLGDDKFLLALRQTSPAVELMRASRRIVAAGAPAALEASVYELGAHHKKRSIDWGRLPFTVEPSTVFRIPTPAGAVGVRELEVIHGEPVGSHMLFVTSVASRSATADTPQLCHVSDMYARWREQQGQPFSSGEHASSAAAGRR